jgi:hypothetical protein
MSSTQTPPASHRGPRRPRRSNRLVVGIAIVAVLIAGGTAAAIAALHGGRAGATTSLDAPKPQEAGATTPVATPSPTSTSPTPTPTPSDSSGAAVAACRTTVAAAEAAVAAARTGASDWAIHTQAQTELLANKITLAETNARFKKTRLLGPADQLAFARALTAYQRVAGGCKGLPTSSQPDAVTCATKAAALQATVVAGQAVMKDWAAHLNTMALHADHKMSGTQAQAAWIAAWKAAPTNLNAFRAADSASTHTPSCPAG